MGNAKQSSRRRAKRKKKKSRRRDRGGNEADAPPSTVLGLLCECAGAFLSSLSKAFPLEVLSVAQFNAHYLNHVPLTLDLPALLAGLRELQPALAETGKR